LGRRYPTGGCDNPWVKPAEGEEALRAVAEALPADEGRIHFFCDFAFQIR